MKKIYIIIGLVLIVILGWYGFSKFRSPSLDTVSVVKGDVVSKVTVSGKTKAESSVELGFQIGGNVVEVSVDVGDKVYAGQVLAVLNQRELSASLLQAKANLDAERADLADMQNGAKPEDIAIALAEVESAKRSLVDSERTLVNTIEDSYTKSDDAIRNTVDQFFTNGKSANPIFNLVIADQQLISNLNSGKVATEQLLNSWSSNISSGVVVKPEIISLTRINLSAIRSYLDKVATAINSLSASASVTQTILDGYKSDVSTARTSINTAITNFQSAEATYNSDLANIEVERRQYESAKSGSSKEEIEAQMARVKQYEAQVASAEAQLGKTLIVSPINGIVTKQDAKLGQVVGANTPLVSVMSLDKLLLEAYVPEINVAKILVGNKVNISFDAFPSGKFVGKLGYIEPAETLLDGIANFKVKVTVDNPPVGLKSGMTATLEIVGSERSDVVVIPQYTVMKTENGSFVSVVTESSEIEKRSVILGMQGDNGFVEVISGLVVNEKILISPVKK